MTSAVQVAATSTVPTYCLVEAHARPTSDSDIKILVGLPTAGNWNGKFLQSGNGGFAGSVAPPTGSVQLGYVGAATDDGHTASGFDASWALGHPEKVVDFGYRALKETTDTAKALIAAFYGASPRLSYFSGCSDGGREALQEAQRYPGDWDGIVVGAPANFWTHHFTGFVFNQQVIANTPISGAKLPAIQAAALAQCDESDGVVDGVVENPGSCRFDPGRMLCTGAENDSCLTQAQVSAVRAIMNGPHDPRTGGLIYPGYVFNAVNDPNFLGLGAWIFNGAPAFGLSTPVQFVFGDQFFSYMVFGNPSWNFATLNFMTDVDLADAKTAGILNSTNRDLSAIESRGAKMIMYHGWEDGAISPFNSINYYESVVATQGEAEGRAALQRTQDFFRLFMVPGMLHCGAGPGPNSFDTLTALANWVERGQAPDRIVATKYVNDNPASGTVRTRPLCPFPQVAVYKGHGSTNVASNFDCRNPKAADHEN
ncbi:MAG: tannase/feruloyl esterase family alpha/beta hydrolase [Myxococcales bacterium]